MTLEELDISSSTFHELRWEYHESLSNLTPTDACVGKSKYAQEESNPQPSDP